MSKKMTALLFAALLAAGSAHAAGDIANGEKLFNAKCTVCHALDANKVGPMLHNVYGRPAGKVNGYAYSQAVKNLDFAWADDTLDKWLTNPPAMVEGTKMSLRLTAPQDRADVIAYLKALSKAAQVQK